MSDVHTFALSNEFADVLVRIDQQANGVRLAIVDKRTGMTAFLDPLVLESLAWTDYEDLYSFVDPAARWPALDGDPLAPDPLPLMERAE